MDELDDLGKRSKRVPLFLFDPVLTFLGFQSWLKSGLLSMSGELCRSQASRWQHRKGLESGSASLMLDRPNDSMRHHLDTA